MMAWVVAIEGLVLIEKIAFCDQTAVDVAIFENDGGLALVLDVGDFFAGKFAECAMEDEKFAVTKNDSAAFEGGVALKFAVEGS
jgi:hypothetical protein